MNAITQRFCREGVNIVMHHWRDNKLSEEGKASFANKFEVLDDKSEPIGDDSANICKCLLRK